MTYGNTASLSISDLEDQLNSFDAEARRAALLEIARRIEAGDINPPPPGKEVNLHYHTFFSYNANGWSPSRVAWETKKHGLAVAGIVDFDVLDGREEMLAAGDILKMRTTAAVESRVFIEEYAQHVINSPNEPGIAYFMVAGCFRDPDPGTESAEILHTMREMAQRRTVQVMERVNDYLDKVRLDFDSDVAALTPSGNTTERHLLAAYDAKSRQVFPNENDLVGFWAGVLDISQDEAASLLKDQPTFHEKIRSKLMKFGGVGYVAPTPDTFPPVETVIKMARGMEALPTATWLDGTNSGEADMPAMLALLASKGVVAMNIIPDRNWNIKNPEEKEIKLDNLDKAIQAARDIDFPLSVGTEMNKAGLPFVDNFAAPELQPYISDFIDGAYFFWGHTFLAKAAGLGYASPWADAYFGSDRRRRNEFYTRVGRLAVPGNSLPANITEMSPDEVLAALEMSG